MQYGFENYTSLNITIRVKTKNVGLDASIQPASLCKIYYIPRLHDEAGSTSWLIQLTYIIARCLLDVCSTLVRCLLGVCLIIAGSCKRGITLDAKFM